MKQAQKDSIRRQFTEQFRTFAKTLDDDCEYIASNAFNFPYVAENGEECVIEIYVKIPKDDNDSLSKREEYTLKCDERKAKAEEAAKKKAKKIEKDKAERKAKAESAE